MGVPEWLRGGDELLGIDVQPVQDPRRLAGDVAALVLADHPSGRIHQFQVIIEGKGNRRRHAAGGIEGHQRQAMWVSQRACRGGSMRTRTLMHDSGLVKRDFIARVVFKTYTTFVASRRQREGPRVAVGRHDTIEPLG